MRLIDPTLDRLTRLEKAILAVLMPTGGLVHCFVPYAALVAVAWLRTLV